MRSQDTISENQAATLALEALAHLMASDAPRERFLALTGIEASSLADRANEPDFLASVLDFVLSDEALLTEFFATAAYDARAVHRARAVLVGGGMSE